MKNKINVEKYPDPLFCILPQFSFASWSDIIFTIIGLLAAVLSGICTPGIIMLYGNLAEIFLQYQIASSMTTNNNTTDIPVGYRGQSLHEMNPVELARQTLNFSICSATLGFAQLVFTAMFIGCLNHAATNQYCRARSIHYKALLRQHLTWLLQQNPEDLAATSVKDLNNLQMGLGVKLGNFIATLSASISCILVSMYHGYKLASSLLAVVPVIAIKIYGTRRIIDYIKRQEVTYYKSAQNLVKECLEHVRCICAFTKQHYEVQRYNNELAAVEHCDIMRGTVVSISGATLWIIIYSMYGFAFWQGVQLLSIDKNYSVASLIIVAFCTHIAIFHLFQIPLYVYVIKRAKEAAREILKRVEDTQNVHGICCEDDQTKILTFNRITFGYPLSTELIFQNLSLSIDRSTTVALIGPIGSGKTTFLSLIHRFFAPQDGNIKFNDLNIEEINLFWLRWRIGYAQQCPVLFGSCLLESITCHTSCKSLSYVKTVAEVTGIHSTILNLPKKYNSSLTWDIPIDQRQRLALARILYRQPDVLLMDDCLSALSTHDETKVFDRIRETYEKLTIIIVTNNLQILNKVDKVLYLDGNEIVEFPSVEVLMKSRPTAQELMLEKDGTIDNFELETMIKCRNKQPNCGTFRRTSSFFGRSYQELLRSGLVQIGRYPAFFNLPDASAIPSQHHDKFFRRMMKFLLQDHKRWHQLLLASLASVVLGLNLPMYTVLFGETLSLIAQNSDTTLQTQFKYFTTMFLIAGFVAGLCKIIQTSMLSVIESKLITRIRRTMFMEILMKKMEWYDTEARTICEILSILRKPPHGQQNFPRRLVFLIEALASLSVSIGLSLFYCWQLGLATLVFTPLTLLLLRYNRILVKKRADDNFQSLNKAKKTIKETVRNAEAIAALTLEDTFIDSYEDDIEKIMINDSGIKLQACVQGCCVALPQVAYAVAMLYGGYMLKNDEIDAGTVFKVAEAIILGTLLVGHLVSPMESNIPDTEGSLNFVNILEKRADKSKKKLTLSDTFEGRIVFDSATYTHSYYEAIPKLFNVNLEIKPGELVAFVGRPHSGVSMPIQLLLGFYELSAGEIFFDDKSLRNLNIQELRDRMGLVEGEPRFFKQTIAYNIGYGVNYKIPASEIVAVSRRVLLHDFIRSLPKGYYTVLDEAEIKLTTSQRIQLSLARALVRNPRILLFDNLKLCETDHAQRLLEEIILNISVGRTCIASTHNPLAVKIFSRLIFINRGIITETGNHAMLIDNKGLYYNLWEEFKKFD